jgi:hypothetical protein
MSVHTILQWVNKDDPRGPAPVDPTGDSQYPYWEYGVRKWFTEYQKTHPDIIESTGNFSTPTATDDVHTADKVPKIIFVSPTATSTINPQSLLQIHLGIANSFIPKKTEVYLNGKYVLTATVDPLNFSFIPADVGTLSDQTNTITVDVFDSMYNKGEATLNFNLNQVQ